MSNERAEILQTVCHVASSGAVQFRVKGRTSETGWVRVGDPTSDFGVAMLIALDARGSFSRIKIEGDDGSIRGTVGRKRAEFTELGVIRWPALPLLASGLRMLVGKQRSDEMTISEPLKGLRKALGGENAC